MSSVLDIDTVLGGNSAASENNLLDIEEVLGGSTSFSIDAVLEPKKEEEETPWLPTENSWGEELKRTVGTAAEGLLNTPAALLHDFGVTDKRLWDVDMVEDPESIAGQVASTVLQFAVPFTGAMKAARAATWGYKLATAGKTTNFAANSARASLIGGATGALVFEADAGNLANVLKEHAGVQNAVIDFLATDSNDPAAVNRLRTFAADAISGPFADVLIASLGKSIRFAGMATGKAASGAAKITPTPIKDVLASRVRKPIEDTIGAFMDKPYGIRTKIDDARIAQLRRESDRLTKEAGETKNVRTQGRKLTKARKLQDEAEWRENGKEFMTLYEEFRMLTTVDQDIDAFFKDGILKRGKHGEKLTVDPRLFAFNKILIRVQKLEIEEEFENFWKYSQAEQIGKANHRRAILKRKEAKKEKNKSKKKKLLARAAEFENSAAGIPKAEYTQGLKDAANSPNSAIMIKELKNLARLNQAFLRILKNEGETLSKADIENYNSISDFHAYFHRNVDRAGDVLRTKQMHVPETTSADVRRVRKLTTEEALDEMPALGDMYLTYYTAVKNQLKHALTNKTKARMVREVEAMGDEGKDILEKITKHTTDADKKLYHKEIIYLNGKATEYLIKAPDIAKNLSSMGPIERSPLFMAIAKPMNWYKRYETKALTTLNPAFSAETNILRDIAMFLLLQHGKSSIGEGVLELVVAAGETMGKPLINKAARTLGRPEPFEDVFQQNLKKGMSFGHSLQDIHISVGEGPEVLGKVLPKNVKAMLTQTVDERLRAEGLGQHADKLLKLDRASVGTWIRAGENILARGEYLAREAQLNRLIRDGYSQQKAIYMVRDMMDFSNTGYNPMWRGLTTMSAFTNTWAQGVYRWMRAMGFRKLMGRKLNKQEATEIANMYSRLGKLSVAFMLVDAYHENAEEIVGDPNVTKLYNEVAEHVMYDNLVIVTPKVGEQDNIIATLALPFEYAIVPQMLKLAMNDYFEPEERKLFGKYMLMQLGRITHVDAMGGLPSWGRYFVEKATNSTFTGAPIESAYEQEVLIPGERARPDTSTLAIEAGRATGVSPLKIEHFLTYVMPGVIGEIAMKLDEMINSDRFPEKGLGETYWTRRLFEPPTKGGRSASVIRELKDEALPVGKTSEYLGKQADKESHERLQEYLKDPEFKRLRVGSTILTGYLESLSSLYTQKTRVAKKSGDPKVKMDKLHSLDKKINKIRGIIVRDIAKYYARAREKEEAKDE